jgi:DNA excision repair protein ERCC-3
LPDNVVIQVGELAARYGRVVLTTDGEALARTCLDRPTAERLARNQAAGPYLEDRIDATHFRVRPALRGVLKQALVAAGFPAEDLAG